MEALFDHLPTRFDNHLFYYLFICFIIYLLFVLETTHVIGGEAWADHGHLEGHREPLVVDDLLTLGILVPEHDHKT